MKIKITEKNLVSGNISCDNCPIALALKDIGCQDVAVHPLFATFEYNSDFLRIDFSEGVINFIDNWDCKYFVDYNPTGFLPFEFNAIPYRVNRGK